MGEIRNNVLWRQKSVQHGPTAFRTNLIRNSENGQAKSVPAAVRKTERFVIFVWCYWRGTAENTAPFNWTTLSPIASKRIEHAACQIHRWVEGEIAHAGDNHHYWWQSCRTAMVVIGESCAGLVEFLVYSGSRNAEAARAHGRDCDFEKGRSPCWAIRLPAGRIGRFVPAIARANVSETGEVENSPMELRRDIDCSPCRGSPLLSAGRLLR
jgi:hypothetical protein